MEDTTTDAAWRVLGELARARRVRMGLKQGDLARLGGPGGTTVGKIERAEQRVPVRTRQQLEKALGWKRGTVDAVLEAADSTWRDDEGLWADYRRGLINDDIPDLTATVVAGTVPSARGLTDEELLAELTYRLRRYADLTLGGDDGRSATTTGAGAAFTTSAEAHHLRLAELPQAATQPPSADAPG